MMKVMFGNAHMGMKRALEVKAAVKLAIMIKADAIKTEQNKATLVRCTTNDIADNHV